MIVPMVKAFAACRERDRDALLGRLRRLGVLHVVPVSGQRADAAEGVEERIRQVEAVLQTLGSVEPAGPRPPHSPDQAVDAVRAIEQRAEEGRARLDVLYREAERLRVWGSVSRRHLRALEEAGVDLRVLVVPERALPYLRGRLIQPLGPLPRNRRLVAAIGLDDASVSAHVEEVAPPRTDRGAVLTEASELERTLHADRQRLAELAWLADDLERERDRLRVEARWHRTLRGGLVEKGLFAVQGWVPAERAPALAEGLGQGPGVAAAVETVQPGPDESPPTLLRLRPWARPVQALYRILGTVPGYREMDASGVFMVTLPLFAGMIIGDAGYGLLFALVPLLAHRLERGLPSDLRTMMVLFGVSALVWGAVTGVWFGFTPRELAAAGGLVGALGDGLDTLRLIRGSEHEARMAVIKVCFVIGTGHLVTAHARRALEMEGAGAWAEVGWCAVLVSMLGAIWILFFGADAAPPGAGAAVAAGLTSGFVLVALYTAPDRPLPSRLGLGVAGSLLPLLGTFSDTLSYIRLMAVGLASYYLGSTFNTLAAELAGSSSWLFGAAVLAAGHGLNIGLILIAIFAHGVRLNVLEFSSNAGIHWTGYPYRPFSDRLVKEQQ